MLQSMTGFGMARGRADGIEYDVEVRSVNHRYFKATIKLPEVWARAEGDVEAVLRKRISRGSVTLLVRMRLGDEQAAYRVNTAALRKYVDQIRELEVEANPTLRIDLASLLQLPGVCEPPTEALCEPTGQTLMRLITEAVDEMVEMRSREGQAIKQDLLNNCDAVEAGLAVVGGRAPEVVKDYHRRLADRVAELINAAKVDLDEEYLAREVAVFAERCDIAEELTRLGAHLEQFRQVVSSEQPSGRKLDFIAQEMLRETNTIGAKANDVEIARAVVEVKTAIDRIKEQVQNVE